MIPGLREKLHAKEQERQAKLDEPFPLSVIVVGADVQQAHSVAKLITNQLKDVGFVKPVLKVTDQFDGLVPAKFPSDTSTLSVLDAIQAHDPALFHVPIQVFGVEGQVRRERYADVEGSKSMAAKVAEYVSESIEDAINNAFEDIRGSHETLIPTSTVIQKGIVIARKGED